MGINEQQDIVLNGATGGSYKLSVSVDGSTYTTAAISATANDATIQAALQALPIAGATYSVVGQRITFTGSLAERNVSTVYLDNTALTGGTGGARVAVVQDGDATPAEDLDLNIASVSSIANGNQGVYLQSTRSLGLGSVAIQGDLNVDVTAGALTLTGNTSARKVTLTVDQSSLTMQDGTTVSATGSTWVQALRDITFSQLQVSGADLDVWSEQGALIDGTVLETPNITVSGGTVQRLRGTAIGTRFEGGALDVSAMNFNSVRADSGGAFLQITGASGQAVTIESLSTAAAGADATVAVASGGLRVNTAQVNDELTLSAGGQGVTQGLLIGNTSAGGHVRLTSTLGNLGQISGTALLADGTGKTTTLVAGGDVVLTQAGNDVAILQITAANADVVDRDGLTLGSSTLGNQLNLTTHGDVAVLDRTTVQSGGDMVLLLNSGNYSATGTSTLQSGRDLSVTATQGAVSSIGAGTMRATRDLSLVTRSGVTLDGTSVVVSGRDMLAQSSIGNVTLTGASQLTSGGATRLATTTGDVALSGTTAVSAVQDLRMTTSTGVITVRGQTTASSRDGELALETQTGQITLQGESVMQGDSVVMAVTTRGSVTLSDTTRVNADSTDLTVTLNQGNFIASGTSDLTAQRALQVTTQTGDIRLSGSSTLRSVAATLTLGVNAGNVSFSQASTLRSGTDTRVSVQTGQLSASGATNLNAGQDVVLSVTTGDVTLRNATTVVAGRDIGMSQNRGNVSASGLTSLSAGRDLSMNQTTGNMSFANTSTLSAGRDLKQTVTTGNVSLSDSTTVGAGQDWSLQVGAGNVTVSGLTAIQAGRDASLGIGTGSLGASGTTTLVAGQDATLSVTTGNVSFANTSTLSAGRDLKQTVTTGNVLYTDNSTFSAGRDMAVDITTGNATLRNTTQWTAGDNLRMSVGRGDVLFFDDSLLRALRGNTDVAVQNGTVTLSNNSHLDAKVQNQIAVQTGEVLLNDNAQLTADDTVAVRVGAKGATSGGLVMEDAETLIQAGRTVTIDTAGDVRIDLIRSGGTVNITSREGAILDNTVAETDLIFGTTLNMSAVLGIGEPWTDNLNVNVREISAYNSARDGINIQNRTAFKVGQQGISNVGKGGVPDISITSGGNIDFAAYGYFDSNGAPGLISNLRGNYRLYVISNMSSAELEEQFGNSTPQLVSAVNTKQPDIFGPQNRPQSLVRGETENALPVTALQRLLEIEQAVEVKPIQVIRSINFGNDNPAASRVLESFVNTNVADPLANSGAARSVLMKTLESVKQVTESNSSTNDGRSSSSPDADQELRSDTTQPDAGSSTVNILSSALRAPVQRVIELSDDSLIEPMVAFKLPLTEVIGSRDDS